MTKETIQAALEVIKAMADTIQALGRVPSGELYARVMGRMNLESYNKVIGTLKRAGLVQEKNHELIWIGPPKKEGSDAGTRHQEG